MGTDPLCAAFFFCLRLAKTICYCSRKPFVSLHEAVGQNSNNSLLVVGHQPDLGDVVSFLVWDIVGARFPLQEGMIVGLDFAAKPQRGKVRMDFLLPPEMAEKIAK